MQLASLITENSVKCSSVFLNLKGKCFVCNLTNIEQGQKRWFVLILLYQCCPQWHKYNFMLSWMVTYGLNHTIANRRAGFFSLVVTIGSFTASQSFAGDSFGHMWWQTCVRKQNLKAKKICESAEAHFGFIQHRKRNRKNREHGRTGTKTHRWHFTAQSETLNAACFFLFLMKYVRNKCCSQNSWMRNLPSLMVSQGFFFCAVCGIFSRATTAGHGAASAEVTSTDRNGFTETAKSAH